MPIGFTDEEVAQLNNCRDCVESFDSGKSHCPMCGGSFVCTACGNLVNPRYNYCLAQVSQKSKDNFGKTCATRARTNVPLLAILRRIKLPLKQSILDIARVREMKNSFGAAKRNATGMDTITADEAGIIIIHAMENAKSSPRDCCQELKWTSENQALMRQIVDYVRGGMRVYRGEVVAQPKNARSATKRLEVVRQITEYIGDLPFRVLPRNIYAALGNPTRNGKPAWMPNGQKKITEYILAKKAENATLTPEQIERKATMSWLLTKRFITSKRVDNRDIRDIDAELEELERAAQAEQEEEARQGQANEDDDDDDDDDTSSDDDDDDDQPPRQRPRNK